jgi:hypothetical protein
MFKVLSLGWGVQSFCLAAMAALGEIEPFDYLLHADTTHERISTYAFKKEWEPWLVARGQRIATVRDERTNPADNEHGGTNIPAFLMTDKGRGQLRRQCTANWKIGPMRRWLQEHRYGMKVELNLGISMDEFKRIRDSDRKYIQHRYQLIELKMTRWDCIRWLQLRGLDVPDRSSCVFCPYHSVAEWQGLSKGDDWEKVIDVDTQLRKARPPYDLFIHQNRKPIEDIDLRTQEEKGQLSMWDRECAGVCGP